MNTTCLEDYWSLPIGTEETWQGGAVPLAEAIGVTLPVDDAPMWLLLWRSTSTGIVHAAPVTVSPGDSLAAAFAESMIEFCTLRDLAVRPSTIQCNDQILADEIHRLLGESETEVCVADEMPDWNRVLDDMVEHFGGKVPELPSLLDAGCNAAEVREFADAAAAFYRAGLWDFLDDLDYIKVEAPEPPAHMHYIVVLGAASQNFGIGFFDDPEVFFDVTRDRIDPCELTLLSCTFENPAETHSGDTNLWSDLDLPVATGDAFPCINFYAANESRRPTPAELDFATVALHALASTSEEEIDSGRWSKLVKQGKQEKVCVLSIPNLLDPPDRAEWMRRGLKPEPRGNERHFRRMQEFVESNADEMSLDELNAAMNARVIRPMDEFEYPMDSPEDRAEAKCYEAIDAFGRRRIQLAKEALAEVPTHIESMVLLAESTRRVDRRIELFHQAVDAGRSQLGPIMEDAVGHFWGVTETRPYMRACHGLALALHEAGRTNDAVAQYLDMLRLNPDDNQGIRYDLIPLLLSLGRELEAIELLNKYQEESAHWHYLKSVVEFRRKGNSASARSAMRSAFRANAHVIPLLQSDAPPPLPESYALGSPEEAAICIDALQEVWAEEEDVLGWMVSEYLLWDQEKAKQLRDIKRKQRRKKAGKKR